MITKEVAGHHDLGMVTEDVQPALFRARCAHWPVLAKVLADGARGDLNAQLELQLIGNAFLSLRVEENATSGRLSLALSAVSGFVRV